MSGRTAIAGFGVSRGLFHGATQDGCPFTAQDCDPLEDGVMPHPGIAGLLAEPSLGVIEATSPSESITQTYEVSCDINSSSKIPSFPFQRSIPLNVSSSLIKFNLCAITIEVLS